MTTDKDPKDFRHKVPVDLVQVLEKNTDVKKVWESLTPLTKNEWICWITIVKKAETREEHLQRFVEELRSGGRRPCCWPGCPHRRPKRCEVV